jgi:hypothetical protein
MTRSLVPATAMMFVFAVSPAAAAPPDDALPLSQILERFEAETEFAYFDEVEWDNDGYWEIEYYRTDGAKVEVDVDPRTGEASR